MKNQLTIKEASRRLGLTTHTLRFWEKELEGVIVPFRTEGGQRRYAAGHISVLEDIKKLKEKGLSLVEIKRILNHRNEDEPNRPNSHNIDFLADKLAEIVRSTIYSILKNENLD